MRGVATLAIFVGLFNPEPDWKQFDFIIAAIFWVGANIVGAIEERMTTAHR